MTSQSLTIALVLSFIFGFSPVSPRDPSTPEIQQVEQPRDIPAWKESPLYNQREKASETETPTPTEHAWQQNPTYSPTEAANAPKTSEPAGEENAEQRVGPTVAPALEGETRESEVTAAKETPLDTVKDALKTGDLSTVNPSDVREAVLEDPRSVANLVSPELLLRAPSSFFTSFTSGITEVINKKRFEEAASALATITGKLATAMKILIAGTPLVVGGAVYATMRTLVGFAIGLVKGTAILISVVTLESLSLARHLFLQGNISKVLQNINYIAKAIPAPAVEAIGGGLDQLGASLADLQSLASGFASIIL